jgi:hypothetical protein
MVRRQVYKEFLVVTGRRRPQMKVALTRDIGNGNPVRRTEKPAGRTLI